jgi:hypothetical protein
MRVCRPRPYSGDRGKVRLFSGFLPGLGANPRIFTTAEADCRLYGVQTGMSVAALRLVMLHYGKDYLFDAPLPLSVMKTTTTRTTTWLV